MKDYTTNYREPPPKYYKALSMISVKWGNDAIVQNKRLKRAIKWLTITALGIALYQWTHEVAYIERAYNAYGGECLLLLMPMWWAIAEGFLNDIKSKFSGNIND